MLHELTASEKKVARTVLSAYPSAGLQSIARLSEIAGVSGPTVIRFVNKLRLESYPEFQQRLIGELDTRHTSALVQFDRRPSGLTKQRLLTHCLGTFEQCLRTTFQELPVPSYWQAVEMLANVKRRVTCVGGRFSDLLAQYMTIHLCQIRPRCRFLPAESSWRTADLLDVRKGEIYVVFDFRRYQKDVVEFAETASAKGAEIILFTDPHLSPIAADATCVLPTVVAGPSPYDTYLPAIGVIETLIAGLIERLGVRARKRVAQLEKMTYRFEADEDGEHDRAS